MDNKLTSILIFVYLLLVPIMLYFKYSLYFTNPLITNLSIFLMIFTLIFLIVYGIWISTTSKEVYLFLVPSMIFAFVVRSIPNLIMSYPPLHDPYFHFITTLNIIDYGTTTPILSSWYSGISIQLEWPMMHILTASLFYLTNIDLMQLFRFQEPFMGIIFFLGVFILARVTTQNDKISAIAALIATFCDSTIFYQSEYHPQGFAFMIFVFLLYSFIKSRSVKNISNRLILIIFIAAFILSHYFSSLFLALICISYIVFTKIFSIIPFIKKTFIKVAGDIKQDMSFLILVIIAALSYQFYVQYSIINQFFESAMDTTPNGVLVSIGGNIPLYTTIFTNIKWITLILALISICYIFIGKFKTKKSNEIRLATFFLCILFAGVIGQFVISGPIDRFIGFYITMASIFASLTLYWYQSNKEFKISSNILTKNHKIILVTLITTIIIVSGIFNSQSPSYFFQDTGTNEYYWYSNELPQMDTYISAGEFINNYIPSNIKNNSYFGTEFDTRIIPMYYGLVPYTNTKMGSGSPESYKELLKDNYILINPNIPYKYSNKSDYEQFDRVYDDGIYLYSQ